VRLLISLVIVAVGSTYLFRIQAQPASNSDHYRVIYQEHAFTGTSRPIVGAPFSADQIFEGQGMTFQESIFRDSQGRIRNERAMTLPDRGYRLIYIDDPVAGCHYIVDVIHKVVHRIAYSFSRAPRIMDVPAFEPVPVTPETVLIGDLARHSFQNDTVNLAIPAGVRGVSQSLGERIVCGIPARGVKTVYDSGIETIAIETWVSDELKMLLLSKRIDSRNREWTTKILNFHAGELDPALFRLPADFVLINEKGSFALDIPIPSSPARQ